jgi:UDP-N-acetylmuramoylalanine--D-glutamate ligase
MQEAVNTAARIAVAGDNVLLSPACASLDQYKNYQERGDTFAQAVLALVNQENPKSVSTLKVGL